MTAAETLGVAPDAPLEAIKHAYYRLARKLHPDHGGKPAEFARVRSAYEELLVRRDPSRGRAYQMPERKVDAGGVSAPSRAAGPAAAPQGHSTGRLWNAGAPTILKVGKKAPAPQPKGTAPDGIAAAAAPQCEAPTPRAAAGFDNWQTPPLGGFRTESSERSRRFHYGPRQQPETSFRSDFVPLAAMPSRWAARRPMPNVPPNFMRWATRVERLPPAAIGVATVVLLILVQGIGMGVPRGPGLLQNLSIGMLILLPASIASLLGADGHFGGRRIFCGVTFAVFTVFCLVARLSI